MQTAQSYAPGTGRKCMTMTAVVGLFDVEQLKRRQEVARRRSALPPSNGKSQPLPFPEFKSAWWPA